MKRSAFLKFFLAFGSLASAPFKTEAKAKIKSRVSKGFMVKNGADRHEKPLSLFEIDKF